MAICGKDSAAFKALVKIASEGEINPTSAEATLSYVEEKLEPVKNEMKNELAGIGIIIVLLIAIIVIVPLIAYLIWISYELKINPLLVVSGIVFILVVSMILILLAISRATNSIENTVDNALGKLDKYATKQALDVTLITLNTAAGVYLNTLGQSC